MKSLKKFGRLERSYRGARTGAIFLSVMAWFAFALVLAGDGTESEAFGPMYAMAFVFPALAYIAHLKLTIVRMKKQMVEPAPIDPQDQ